MKFQLIEGKDYLFHNLELDMLFTVTPKEVDGQLSYFMKAGIKLTEKLGWILLDTDSVFIGVV